MVTGVVGEVAAEGIVGGGGRGGALGAGLGAAAPPVAGWLGGCTAPPWYLGTTGGGCDGAFAIVF